MFSHGMLSSQLTFFVSEPWCLVMVHWCLKASFNQISREIWKEEGLQSDYPKIENCTFLQCKENWIFYILHCTCLQIVITVTFHFAIIWVRFVVEVLCDQPPNANCGHSCPCCGSRLLKFIPGQKITENLEQIVVADCINLNRARE